MGYLLSGRGYLAVLDNYLVCLGYQFHGPVLWLYLVFNAGHFAAIGATDISARQDLAVNNHKFVRRTGPAMNTKSYHNYYLSGCPKSPILSLRTPTPMDIGAVNRRKGGNLTRSVTLNKVKGLLTMVRDSSLTFRMTPRGSDCFVAPLLTMT